MFIRKTACSKYGVKQYFTHRLVENVRTGNGTSQRIVLNLGIDFSFPKENWRSLAKRIEQILYGQRPLFVPPDEIEVAAQQYAAKIIRKQEDSDIGNEESSRHYSIDIDSLETSRPRSVSVEHVAYETIKEMGLEQKLTELGLTRPKDMLRLARL